MVPAAPAIARWVQTTPAGVSWLGYFYGGNLAGATGAGLNYRNNFGGLTTLALLFWLWLDAGPAPTLAPPPVKRWAPCASAPASSADRSNLVYGNWPEQGTQWIEYTWPSARSSNRASACCALAS